MKKLKGSLAEFEIYLLKDRKKSTTRLYLEDFKRLAAILSGDITREKVIQHLLLLLKNGRKATYCNKYIDVVKIWGRFIGDSSLEIPYFKEAPFVKATLADDEIEAFLNIPAKRNGEREGYKHWVWTLFFSICAYSGMRLGEVAHLTIDSVDFGRGIFILEDTKTNQPRYVPIAPNLFEPLKKRISVCKDYLFPSWRGGQHRQNGVFDDVDWSYNFHTRLKRLGIRRKNLSPYSLRHSFITRLLDEDINIFKVQKIVGHSQFSTTLHYTHYTTKDLVNTIKKDPLVRKFSSPIEKIKWIADLIRAQEFEKEDKLKYEMNFNSEGLELRLSVKR